MGIHKDVKWENIRVPSDKASLRRRYLLEIELYERTYKKWEKRAKKIVKRYRDDRGDMESGASSKASKYNILWSNVNTLKPAVFSRLPQPEVSRRYKDKDPVARVASTMLERALKYEIEQYTDYEESVANAVEDRLLPGRGTAWIRYEPVTKSVQISEDESSAEIIDYECAPVDYVSWEDFGHSVARTWEEVTVVWRIVRMTRDELVERFGEEAGKLVKLDSRSDLSEETLSTPEADSLHKATVYEIWDKTEAKAVWLSKGYPEALDEKDDPLKLDDFFPCPKPLYATTTTDSLVPVPDYVQYQDQAMELDDICDRISGLVKAVKVVGVYDASQSGVQRMLQEGVSNSLIPVDSWSIFAEKGGIKGVVDFMPLDMVVSALNSLYMARDQVKQVIYEVTGISDIVRGATDPNETLGAQQLKGQFASSRLRMLQDGVTKFATRLLQLKAQVICNHYQDESILQISGADQLSQQEQQMIPAALELLRDDVLRDFRISVSSDSMIQADEQAEKNSRMEFIQSVSAFIKEAVMAPPELAPLFGEVLMYGVRGFKAGQGIEGVIEEAVDNMVQQTQQQAQQQQQAQLPSPEALQMQAEAEAKRIETELQMAQMAHDAEIKKSEIAADSQVRIAQISAGMPDPGPSGPAARTEAEMAQVMQAIQLIAAQMSDISSMVERVAQNQSAPVKYQRGPDGKISLVMKGDKIMGVEYGPDGRIQGVS